MQACEDRDAELECIVVGLDTADCEMCLAVNSVEFEIDILGFALVQVAVLQFGIVIVGIDVMFETGPHLG